MTFNWSGYGAFGRGELYNSDPNSGDARLCGTTASLCGIEKEFWEQNEGGMEQAIRFDLMLHAYMFVQSGIPVLYSGDEVGQLNDYSYHEDPDKCQDSRYIHRGRFQWDLAEKRKENGTLQHQIFETLAAMEEIRFNHKVFDGRANVWTLDTWDNAVLGVGRWLDGEKLIALFNFSNQDKTAWINENDGVYTDLLTGIEMEAKEVQIPAYGVWWLYKKE